MKYKKTPLKWDIALHKFIPDLSRINKKRSLITFDLDNTLLNSDKAHVEAYQYALKKLKQPILEDKEIYIHFGKPKNKVAKAIAPKADPKKVTKYHDKYLWKKSYKLSKIIPGVIPILNYLEKKYNLALISNCKRKSIMKLLEGSGLNKNYFHMIIGDDQVLRPKPWPDEIFLIEKLSNENVAYHIGDSIYDLKAAKKAKVKSIGILSGHYTKKQLEKEKPFKIIKSIKELKNIL